MPDTARRIKVFRNGTPGTHRWNVTETDSNRTYGTARKVVLAEPEFIVRLEDFIPDARQTFAWVTGYLIDWADWLPYSPKAKIQSSLPGPIGEGHPMKLDRHLGKFLPDPAETKPTHILIDGRTFLYFTE